MKRFDREWTGQGEHPEQPVDSTPPTFASQQSRSLLEFYVSPKKIAQFFSFLVAGLVLASTAGQIFHYFFKRNLRGLVPLFHLGNEGNIPAFYSALALLLCCILLAVIAIAKHREGDRYMFHWKCLSLIFLYLSVDEACQLHEKLLMDPNRSALDANGFFFYSWIVPAAGLVLIFVLAYWRFIAVLPARTQRLFIIAGGTYIAGALGMEHIGGWFIYLSGTEKTAGNILYGVATTLEETLEMLGIVIFIYALVAYLRSFVKLVQVHIGYK